jgi:hypothetical protein
MDLPHCDTLFLGYFDPWYDERDRKRRGYEATRPDVEQLNVAVDLSASDVSPLSAESQQDAAQRIQDMFEAASEDWTGLLGVKGAPSIAWIAEFDRHYTRPRIQQIVKRSNPKQYDNDYFVLCCELGAVLGTVLQAIEPRLSWLYDWPYWESALYDRQTRSRINVFNWAVKKMSEYGVDDGLTEKLEACRKLLREG